MAKKNNEEPPKEFKKKPKHKKNGALKIVRKHGSKQ